MVSSHSHKFLLWEEWGVVQQSRHCILDFQKAQHNCRRLLTLFLGVTDPRQSLRRHYLTAPKSSCIAIPCNQIIKNNNCSFIANSLNMQNVCESLNAAPVLPIQEFMKPNMLTFCILLLRQYLYSNNFQLSTTCKM